MTIAAGQAGKRTLEAAVVLLVDELGVPTNAPHEVWRAAVAEHEARSARLFDI